MATTKITGNIILDQAIAKIKKDFPREDLITTKPTIVDLEAIPTGALGLDIAIGIGGVPKDRIIEIYGPESCLAYDSHLNYEVWAGNKKINSKGGTIRRLFERFHNKKITGEPNQGRHLQKKKDIQFYVKSVDNENRVLRNRVLDVVHTGKKLCYRITTANGQELLATAEHKFKTPDGFIALSDLQVGQELFIHNNTRNTGRKNYENRKEIYVKYHPYWPTKTIVEPSSGKRYVYHRGQYSRFVYEAYLNGLSIEEYRDILNTSIEEDINKLIFLDQNQHIHHIDENFNNNDISNLDIVSPQTHGYIHAIDRIINLSFIAIPSVIVSIEEVGYLETYDLKCAYPYNNYIANGIVVHNSGKTSIALAIAAKFQSLYPERYLLIVDIERTMTQRFLTGFGINTDRLVYLRPDTTEEALQSTMNLVRSGEIGFLIFDSIDGLLSDTALKKNITDADVGGVSKILNRFFREYKNVSTDGHCTSIFINQLKYNPSVMMGNPETTPGGTALKFYASLRIRASAAKPSKNIKDAFTAILRLKKNKCMAPVGRDIIFDFIYAKGPDPILDTLNTGKDLGVLAFGGQSLKLLNEKGEEEKLCSGGTQGFKELVEADPTILTRIRNICIDTFRKNTEMVSDAEDENDT